MISYLDLVKNSNGTKETMWCSIKHIDKFLEDMNKVHPELVDKFLYEEYVIMNGEHFNEVYAKKEVSEMCHFSSDGSKIQGEVYDVKTCMSILPEDKRAELMWDAYVGVNGFAHDMARMNLGKEDLMKAANEFWFHEDDFQKKDCKVFWYFSNKWYVR